MKRCNPRGRGQEGGGEEAADHGGGKRAASTKQKCIITVHNYVYTYYTFY